MKKLLVLMVLASLASFESSAGPRVTGNGGGGVKQNGVYKTFYSAGMYINPVAKKEIPGLELLKEVVLGLDLGNSGSAMLFKNVLPSEERKYYDYVDSEQNKKLFDKLIEEYKRVVNQEGIDLTIFAITDITTKTTYLLPSFYELKSEVEQAAILYHESYWLLNPKADYSEVIGAEMAFQEFVEEQRENRFSSKFPRQLDRLLKQELIALRAALKADMEFKTEPEIIENSGFRLDALFSPEKDCGVGINYSTTHIQKKEKTLFSPAQHELSYFAIIGCGITGEESMMKNILPLAKKFNKSYFLKELINTSVSLGITKLRFEMNNTHSIKALYTDKTYSQVSLEAQGKLVKEAKDSFKNERFLGVSRFEYKTLHFTKGDNK